MEMHITPTKALSRFLQLLDGAFPSGAFVHSFGLEPHIVLGFVNDKESLKNFLENIIEDQYQKMEFTVVKKVFALLKKEKLNHILKEDKKFASMLSYQWAKASKDLGENYLKHIDFDIKNKIVKNYFEKVKNKEAYGNELFILSSYAYELGLDADTFLLLWCKKNLINIASTSLKISRIKPSEIQQLLFSFDERIEEKIKNSSKNMSNFNPLFEEVIFSHLNLEPKMFVT
ncbi:urease [Arcobacter sp. CECT 8983]|uniref:urease accessory protein UreF n=1 Tax=Arcobacter sp. CECT 8983 TaxID=2044508 RepID=UPI00100C213C|nr:urease accessory UreF family protein [Arcobacter sp. CECT 8983]RXJ91623.1 urease [Arcobacter sp. CECT 8983]